MNKIYYIISFFALQLNAQNITFSDANFLEYLLRADYNSNINNKQAKDLNGNYTTIDVNYDGQISISEAENISELVFYTQYTYPKINSIEGVSYFKNLKKLQVSYSNLTNVDVSSLSLLESLSLANNQITILNINNLVKLKHLDVGNNQLSGTINTNHLLNLETFACTSNQLTSLDLSNNINLSTVSTSFNKLVSLKIEFMPKLRFLYCNNNLLSTLDLSKNGSLYFGLYCDNNQLTYLNIQDIANNTGNSYFSGTNNPNLATVCVNSGEVNWYSSYFSSVGINNVNVSVCPLGISEVDSQNKISFQNPIQNELIISTKEEIKLVELYSLEGRLVKTSRTKNINAIDLKSGVYIMKISLKNGNIITEKIIKK